MSSVRANGGPEVGRDEEGEGGGWSGNMRVMSLPPPSDADADVEGAEGWGVEGDEGEGGVDRRVRVDDHDCRMGGGRAQRKLDRISLDRPAAVRMDGMDYVAMRCRKGGISHMPG